MGGKSTTQTTNAATTNTTTPNAPAWATNSLQDFNNKVNAFGATDPQSLVAPENALQQQAGQAASTLGSVWQPQLSQANSTVNSVLNTAAPQAGVTNTTSQSLLDGLQNYINPYTQNVVNSTLNDFDANAGQTLAANAAKAAANNAFGGSRYGIQEAQTTSDLARARAATESGLLNTAFNTATGLSNEDAARRQSTSDFNAGAANTASIDNANLTNDSLNRNLTGAGLLGNLASTGDTLANNDINQQATQGANERAITGAQDTAGLNQLQALGALLGQNQFGLLTGQTSNGTSNSTTNQTTNPGLLGSIGQGLGVAGALGSSLTGAGGLASLGSLFSGATANPATTIYGGSAWNPLG